MLCSTVVLRSSHGAACPAIADARCVWLHAACVAAALRCKWRHFAVVVAFCNTAAPSRPVTRAAQGYTVPIAVDCELIGAIFFSFGLLVVLTGIPLQRRGNRPCSEWFLAAVREGQSSVVRLWLVLQRARLSFHTDRVIRSRIP
jgi:hypothetical protein